MRKHDLLLLEVDGLNKCIEQWISFLDMFAKGKRMSEEYYKRLSAVGVDLPTSADNLAADQRSIDYVKSAIEEYQDKRDRALDRLSEAGLIEREQDAYFRTVEGADPLPDLD